MKLQQQLRSARTLWVGLCLLLCCLLGGLTVSSGSAFAAASTLTLSVDSDSLLLELKPTSPNGTFASSSNLAIGANTNNYTGYTLKISAKTADDRNLSDKDNNDNTAYFAPLTAATTLTTFADDTESGLAYNNKWGYLPSRYCITTEVENVPTTTCSNNSNNTYLPAPGIDGDILDITNNANASSATSDNNNYTIAIGARATTSTKAATYEGTFVIRMVANPTPYTITYNKNTEDTVTDMPENETSSVQGDTATISNTVPKRDGYILTGWCTVAVADGATCESPNTKYSIGGTYTLDQTAASNSLNLYAMWGDPPTDLTFKVGDSNIETIIIADSSQNYKPFYATSNQDIVFSSPTEGTKYIVTVVPKSNYKLGSWDRLSYAGILASTTLLTTTYIAGSMGETFTATSVAGSYDTMQVQDPESPVEGESGSNISDTLCPTTGANVTDSRDGKSYTVAKFGNYCYMLSNLRLDNTMDNGNGGTTARVLTKADSDIKDGGVTYIDPETGNEVTKTSFTMPNVAWANWYCKANMKHYSQNNGSEYRDEYYYNWYTAKANPYPCTSPTSDTNATETNDALALGSICPKGWTLPNYNDITAATLWNDGANPGMLATSGNFYSGSQSNLGSNGYWWSSARGVDNYAYGLRFSGTSADRYNYNKYSGFSVRCMRSS